MVFKVEEMAVHVVEALAPLMPRLRARDRSLADQLMRAASSVVLNIGESNYSDPGNRRARLFTAAGSANETRLALRVAVAWRIFKAEEIEAACTLLDGVLRILWKLTH
jgi:four helix bundle protein